MQRHCRRRSWRSNKARRGRRWWAALRSAARGAPQAGRPPLGPSTPAAASFSPHFRWARGTMGSSSTVELLYRWRSRGSSSSSSSNNSSSGGRSNSRMTPKTGSSPAGGSTRPGSNPLLNDHSTSTSSTSNNHSSRSSSSNSYNKPTRSNDNASHHGWNSSSSSSGGSQTELGRKSSQRSRSSNSGRLGTVRAKISTGGPV
mmetsp:Transcript_7325/g.21584  ORF Transcript_7325/g.21584 Transcript_7325/m.21584 type:complete len:201 (-) Transcript_7325:403-1005(-)